MNSRREHRKRERLHRRTMRRVQRRRKKLWGSGTSADDPLEQALPDSLKPYKTLIWLHFLDHL